MKYYILASLLLFILAISRAISHQKKVEKQAEKSFWSRERRSNSVRRKSLDGLPYIDIPLDTLPVGLLSHDKKVQECIGLLRELSSHPIVNFTGWSNTDLKLEYGTANITALSEYDQNYTVMVRTLQDWADILWEADYRAEAVSVMEFAVSTRTDISRTYYMLAQYYASRDEKAKLQSLTETAESLRSANKNPIVRKLKEFCP